MQCLKDLLMKNQNNREIVTLEEFGRMLEWFGPLEKGDTLLRNIQRQLGSKGFFGFCEASDAEKLLSASKKGTYLVRFSGNKPGCYAITVFTGTHKHLRIEHQAGTKYILGKAEFDTLEALIKANKKEFSLNIPLAGSKYESLFTAYEKKIATEGYMGKKSSIFF